MGIVFGGNNLVIEYNHIRHMNLETEDTGAVYTGGRDWISSRGTVIRYNYFHDMLGFGRGDDGRWESPHFAWGVYLDDNAGGVDVIGNIVVRRLCGLIHLHNGRDNLIENNIFVGGIAPPGRIHRLAGPQGVPRRNARGLPAGGCRPATSVSRRRRPGGSTPACSKAGIPATPCRWPTTACCATSSTTKAATPNSTQISCR